MKKKRKVVLILTFNNRGQQAWIGLLLAVPLVIVLVIVAIFSFNVLDDFNTDNQADASSSAESKTATASVTASFPNLFDGLIILMVVIMWIFCLYSGYNAANNPVMLIVGIFLIIALAVVSMFLNNVWDEINTDATTGSVAALFPLTNVLLQNYLVVVIVMASSTLIVSFYGRGGL